MTKTYKIDQQTVDPQMSAAIRRFHFYTWWAQDDPDRAELFEIVNKIRRACGLAAYSYAKFDEGWQYRTVHAEDYKHARDEMFNLCFGWW